MLDNVEVKSSFDRSLKGVSSKENEAEVEKGYVNNVLNDFSVRDGKEMAIAGGGFQYAHVLMGMIHWEGKIS